MIGRIIGCFCCTLCGLAFLYIAVYEKDNKKPISFWNGDESLKNKIKNVTEYNKNMSNLYKCYSISYFIAAIGFVIYPILGVVLICLDCTLGIYIVYRFYKKYLELYS